MDKPELTAHVEGDAPHRDSLDSVTREAVGGHSTEDLPKNYFRSPQYIGSFIASAQFLRRQGSITDQYLQSMAFAYQGAFLGYVMPANVLTIIDKDLGPSPNIVWVLLVYVLCQTITYTLVGRFSDIFGRRWFFIGANTLALVGYVICGCAHSINMVIAGSALSGFGSAVQQSMPVISGELVPNHNRHLALGITFAFLAPLSTIGPGLARVFTDRATWRWVYYLVVIFSGISLILQLICYHPPSFHQLHTHSSKRKALRTIDYGGVVIFAGSATSLLLGISWGGQKYPWHSAHVIGTIVAGGMGLIVFTLWERFTTLGEPLIPLYLFKNRNYVCLMIVASVGSMIFYALAIVWPQQIAALYGASQEATGWISCTLTAGAVFGQFVGSFSKYSNKVLKMKWQLVLCCVLFTAFSGGMAAVSNDHKGRAIAFSILSSAMIGYMEVITLAGAPLMVDPKNIGLANGVEYTVRSGMSVLADSIFVTILGNKLAHNLVKYVAPAALKAGLPATSIVAFLTAIGAGNLVAVEAVPGVTPAVLHAAAGASVTAYEKSFQTIYLVTLAFGCCAIIASLLVDSEKLEEKMTTDIARKLQGVEKKPLEKEEDLKV